MMCSAIPLSACFAVLATLTNAIPELKGQDGILRVYKRDDKEIILPRPLYEKDGFLAGEETPVWFSGYHWDEGYPSARHTYDRIQSYGTTIVKKSLNYWNSLKKRRGFPIRKTRSIDDRENLTYTEQFDDALTNARINRFDSPSPVEKRSTDGNEVVYPSILVVLDYRDVFPTADKQMPWIVEQLILYTLAFWGTVDSSLRNIQNPRVSLRIAGIVITSSREASPYLNHKVDKQIFDKALSPMIDFWRSVPKLADGDFPIGSYDIVAHMTDIEPWYGKIRARKDFTKANHPILGIASEGPPCKLKDQIGGIIIHDDLAFDGIHRAITQMIKVLGGNDYLSREDGYPRRKWTMETLDSLSKALKDTTCMSAPKEYYQPGTPVPPILAGELMPSVKQCELGGYEPDAWTCWDTSYTCGRSNCLYLRCSNRHVWGVTCSSVGMTLDGSFCNAENTKICLDGQCVNKELASQHLYD